nr:hypothetical protein [uncultured Draconibacterium sp.]
MNKDEIRALIVITIFFLLTALGAKAQNPDSYTPIKEVDDILINRYVVYHGDTIDLAGLGGDVLKVEDSTIYVSHTFLSSLLGQSQYNAVTLGDSALAKGFSITPEQEIEFNYSQFIFTENVGTTEYGQGWNGSSKLTTEGYLYNKMEQFESSGKTVFKITLPAASSVFDRIEKAVEGTDYPSGWILSDMVDGEFHISINHGLGRRVAGITVCSVDGTEERQLRPYSAAYMGWYTPDTNNLVIETLCQSKIKVAIYIVFE